MFVIEVPLVLGLLALVTFLSLLAPRLRVPVPTLMVFGGLCISLIPGLPQVSLPPDLVFLVFLPPLLYAAAWQLPWHDFKRNLRPILQLAIGLVLLTALCVMAAMQWIVPEIPWTLALALGGILGPPDAIAATSVTKGLGVPTRIVTILEGESLVNDATGLVIFRLGIAATLTGTFVYMDAVSLFFVAAIGGILVGLVLGWIIGRIHLILDEPTVETVLTLITPYAAYLAAEHLHVSGVLATVTVGIMICRRQDEYFSPRLRLQATAVWQTLDFILNGLAFVLIGLQLPTILKQLSLDKALWTTVLATVVVYLTVVLVRLLWIYPAAWIPRAISKRIRARDPMPPLSYLMTIGWCGMRGVVSLAAALSIPELTRESLPFPYRGMLIAITFGVVLGSLFIQGLTLAPLVRRLRLTHPQHSSQEQEIQARLELVASAISFIESRAEEKEQHPELVRKVRDHFERQGEIALTQLTMLQLTHEEAHDVSRPSRDLFLGALRAQRRKLKHLHQEGVIHGESHQRLVDALDMDETRFRQAFVAQLSRSK
jgi:monovalent cation/hydrogen antiporter